MNYDVSPPDVGSSGRPGRLFYGWWILVACSLLALFGSGINLGLTLFVVPMLDELDMSIASIARIFILAGFAGTVAGLLVGWLVDRFGSRP